MSNVFDTSVFTLPEYATWVEGTSQRFYIASKWNDVRLKGIAGDTLFTGVMLCDVISNHSTWFATEQEAVISASLTLEHERNFDWDDIAQWSINADGDAPFWELRGLDLRGRIVQTLTLIDNAGVDAQAAFSTARVWLSHMGQESLPQRPHLSK